MDKLSSTADKQPTALKFCHLQQNANDTQQQTRCCIQSYIKRFADFANVFGCKAVIIPVKPTVPEILGSTKYTKHRIQCDCPRKSDITALMYIIVYSWHSSQG